MQWKVFDFGFMIYIFHEQLEAWKEKAATRLWGGFVREVSVQWVEGWKKGKNSEFEGFRNTKPKTWSHSLRWNKIKMWVEWRKVVRFEVNSWSENLQIQNSTHNKNNHKKYFHLTQLSNSSLNFPQLIEWFLIQ